MNSFCILKDAAFKSKAAELNISEGTLENILYEYRNSVGDAFAFPSDAYIQGKLMPADITEISEAGFKVYRALYSKPFILDSKEAAEVKRAEIANLYGNEHVSVVQTNDGKYKVQAAKLAQSAVKPGISIVPTPIKEQYKGKLIFAQSGTGKTSIADNIDVFDSDFLLADIMGVPTSLAHDAFSLLNWSEKSAISEAYKNKIREKIAQGKTVITANLSMLDECDVVVYQESAELADERTNAEDRTNRFKSSEYQKEALEKINNYKDSAPTKEFHSLSRDRFLGNVILNDPSFNVNTERVQRNPLNVLINDFVNKLGINIEEWSGENSWIDITNRIIYAKNAAAIPEEAGKLVAFMMQYNPLVKRIVTELAMRDGVELVDSKGNQYKVSRETMYDTRGNIGVKYHSKEFVPVKEKYLGVVAAEITKELKNMYSKKKGEEVVKDPLLKRIGRVVREFLDHIFKNKEKLDIIHSIDQNLREYTKTVASNILAGNEGFINKSLVKPGDEHHSLVEAVEVDKAFRDFPMEAGIVKKMSNEGIALAGSTSLATEAIVMRPPENPLHDLDFELGKIASRDEVEEMLARNFIAFQPSNTIMTDEGDRVATYSYLVLNKPFKFKDSPMGASTKVIVDATNEDVIFGTLSGKGFTKLELTDSSVDGKVLDFFSTEKRYEYKSRSINGTDYLFTDARGTIDAKVAWQRIKDMFDYNRAIRYDFKPNKLPESLVGESTSKETSLNSVEAEKSSIKEKAINEGTFMKAPNGKDTKLSEDQWAMVRTSNFKEWFGDWENDPENASKVVDENGEPMVVYHNTDKEFTKFSKTRALIGKLSGSALFGKGFYFSNYKGDALGKINMPVFLDIKIPSKSDMESENDGMINKFGNNQVWYAVKSPNQIKSATSNNGEFSTENNNIYSNRDLDKKATVLDALTQEYYDGNPIVKKTRDGYFLNTHRFTKDSVDLIKRALANLQLDTESVGIMPDTGLIFERSKESPIEDTIAALEESSDMFDSAEERNRAISVLEFLKDKTGLNYKFISLAEAKRMGQGVEGQNAFVSGNTAYFINNRKFNTDIASEEMLHPFVASIRLLNSEAFASLYNDARKLFSKLSIQITKAYNGKGVNTIKEEIVTQALSRAFREDVKETPSHHPFTDFIKKFLFYIKGFFRNTGDMPIFTNTDRLYAYDLGKEITIKNLAYIVNSDIKLGNANYIGYSRSNIDTKNISKKAQKSLDRNEKFLRESASVVNGITNLLESDLITASEVRELSEKAVYWISDNITNILNDPSLLAVQLPDRFGQIEPKELERKVKGLSRVELARMIGAESLMDLCREHVFNVDQNPAIAKLCDEDMSIYNKIDLIRANFKSLIRLSDGAFSLVEEFSLKAKFDQEGNLTNDFEVTNNEGINADELNNTTDLEVLSEVVGSLQEHWQVESRTLDAVSSMSQIIKASLNTCYVLDKDGNIEVDQYGIRKRVSIKDATQSILVWTKGCIGLEDMTNMLKEQIPNNPWIKQIVDRLTDNSGKNSTYQSQFYGVFKKPFQAYSVTLKERQKDGTYLYKTIQANENPAYRTIKEQVRALYINGSHPLFSKESGVNKENLGVLKKIYSDLKKIKEGGVSENNIDTVNAIVERAAAVLGVEISTDVIINANITTEGLGKMTDSLRWITENLENASNLKEYDPFSFSDKNAIGKNLEQFLKPLTDKMNETAISSIYDSGKMYQSYITPSYLTDLFDKFSKGGKEFLDFIEREYGEYSWFKDSKGWRNIWLKALASPKISDEERQKLFKHKVELSFNKHNYMKNMDDAEYTLSLLTQFFSEVGNAKAGKALAWFRIPMMSNKPSSEFIRFYRYVGDTYQERITNGMVEIFNQELSRIQTCRERGLKKGEPGFIKNFDTNGKKFCFLDFFNDYLSGPKAENTRLGKLLNATIKGEVLNDGSKYVFLSKEAQIAELNKLAGQYIEKIMNERCAKSIEEFKKNGVFEAAKQISGIGKENAQVQDALENFYWNDAFASMNILQLTITDKAFYKDEEDLQKRLAQLHAPGIRANVEATWYNPKTGKAERVSDGIFRTALLKDFDSFKSNIIDNLTIVFDRKIDELRKSGASEETIRAQQDVYKGIIEQYHKINVADAQGYSCPTSYRKKAIMFGKWSDEAEAVYNDLLSGNISHQNLSVAFQVMKPFVYGQIGKPAATKNNSNPTMSSLKVPVQFKNSEYLLIMADAILRNEETGKPNLLRAIYDVMEESARINPTRGLDTIQFESTCKSGLMTPIDLVKFYDAENGEALAKEALKSAIYDDFEANTVIGEDGSSVSLVSHTNEYNTAQYVYEVPFQNYAIQQEVPEHFKDHSQAHGSQIRMITPSDLEVINSRGEEVRYSYKDTDGTIRNATASEFRSDYENTISANIEESLDDLANELCLNIGNSINGEYIWSRKDRNVALSRLLSEEINSSPRYGSDLLLACSVNPETGEFNVPLGDPIQAKRVEQLINSIIKNKVNKQKIAGGPVVQVSNFGTSQQLNIRFKGRDGELLKTRAEWEASDNKGYAKFEDYIKENQAGIAYYEVFAPIYVNELFNEFSDAKGNIDIEAIKKVNPELLDMVGYRIPTEDKYSAAPLKIVGFLPREAGEGIMLPNDITLLTGSDFDIDKFYLMRKDFRIKSKPITKELTEYMYTKAAELKGSKLTGRDKFKIKQQVIDFLQNPIEMSKFGKLSKMMWEYYISNAISVEEPSNMTARRNNKIVDMTLSVLTNETTADKMLTPGGFDPEKSTGYKIAAFKNTSNKYDWSTLTQIERGKLGFYEGIEEPHSLEEFKQILGNEFNAGDFTTGIDALKSLCYTNKNLCFADTHIQFYKQNSAASTALGMAAVQKIAHATLESNGFALNISGLYKQFGTSKFTIGSVTFSDLMEFDAKYDASGKLIGRVLGEFVAMFADAVKDPVANLMNINNTTMSVASALIRFGVPMEQAAMLLSQNVLIDCLKESQSKNLVRFTASLGKIIDEKIQSIRDTYNIGENSALNFEPFTEEEMIKGMSNEEIDEEELAKIQYKGLLAYKRAQVLAREIKGPTYATRFNSISNAVGPLIVDNLTMEHKMDRSLVSSNLTADNFSEHIVTTSKAYFAKNGDNALYIGDSITLEDGTTVTLTEDNLIYLAESGIIEARNMYTGKASFDSILKAHPILNSFSKAVDIARSALSEMPLNSANFRSIVQQMDPSLSNILFNDTVLFKEFGDFYLTYLFFTSNRDIEKVQLKGGEKSALDYYMNEFPKAYLKANLKQREGYSDNALIQAISYKEEKGKTILKVDITGMDQVEKEKLGSAWSDLFKKDERLARALFFYNFFRTGLAFSPKSFMNLFPANLKSKIPGYYDAFKVNNCNFALNMSSELVVDLFVQNNADNYKLAPLVKLKDSEGKGDVIMNRVDTGIWEVTNDASIEYLKDKAYIKIKVDGSERLLKRTSMDEFGGSTYCEIPILGNNGEYIEMSNSTIKSPLNKVTVTEERDNGGEAIDRTEMKPQDTDEPIGNSLYRTNKDIFDLTLELFTNIDRDKITPEDLDMAYEARVKRYREDSTLREKYKNQIINFIRKRLSEFRIKIEDALVNSIYKEIC